MSASTIHYTLSEFNTLGEAAAIAALKLCCSSQRWQQRMVAARPFSSSDALFETADSIWQEMTEQDYLEAFDGHPKIGDVNTLREKYANTKALASGEQDAVQSASEETLLQLAEGNQHYLAKNGFIFIVSATGKSAEEMLALLNARLPNDRATELANAAAEQAKITRIRLEKLIPPEQGAD